MNIIDMVEVESCTLHATTLPASSDTLTCIMSELLHVSCINLLFLLLPQDKSGKPDGPAASAVRTEYLQTRTEQSTLDVMTGK